MPKLHGLAEVFDSPLSEVKPMTHGQRFFQDRESDEAYAIYAIGVRLPNRTRGQQDILLDSVDLRFVINGKHYGTFPGSLCSIHRVYKDGVDPGEDPVRVGQIPGYVFIKPMLIAVRKQFFVELVVSPIFGRKDVAVQVFIIGVDRRDVPRG